MDALGYDPVTWGDELGKTVVKHVEETMLPPKIRQASSAMKAAAPAYRDVKATTGAGLSEKLSKPGRAVIWLFSDPQQPDVFETAGLRTQLTRGTGRPRGSTNGTRAATRPYSGGVDLANISNGARTNASRRSTPMPTAGWFDRGVNNARQAFK